jgi:hypothetical protein
MIRYILPVYCRLCKDRKKYSKESLKRHIVGFHKKFALPSKKSMKIIEQIDDGTWGGFEHGMVS